MLNSVITYLNLRLENLGYFNEILCLAEKIEREGRVYPALYNGNNEYNEINLDQHGSVSYWRKNGDVSLSEEEDNATGCSVQYKTTIPLKLVGFLRKDSPYNDQYFSENIISEIIAELTTNNSILKKSLKAKSVRVSANKYVTDYRAVSADEYDNINFEARYTHSHFSIDFNLEVLTNQNCFTTICHPNVFNFNCASVTIIDQDGNVIDTIPSGSTYQVLVFSGIDGGNSITIYTNSIVAVP